MKAKRISAPSGRPVCTTHSLKQKEPKPYRGGLLVGNHVCRHNESKPHRGGLFVQHIHESEKNLSPIGATCLYNTFMKAKGIKAPSGRLVYSIPVCRNNESQPQRSGLFIASMFVATTHHSPIRAGLFVEHIHESEKNQSPSGAACL